MDRREFLQMGALAIGGLMAGVEDLIIGPKPLQPVAFLPALALGDDWALAPEPEIPETILSAGGTYTPTLTNTLNLAASTPLSCQYIQVGSVVMVSGRVQVDPTALTVNTALNMSLPVASNLQDTNQLGGTGMVILPSTLDHVAITGDATNNNALFEWNPTTTDNKPMTFIFAYRVIAPGPA